MAEVIPLLQDHSTNRLNGRPLRDSFALASIPFYSRWWHSFASIFSTHRRQHTSEEISLLNEVKTLKLDLAEAQTATRKAEVARDKLDAECEVMKSSIDNLNLAIQMMDMRYKAIMARDAARASMVLDNPEVFMAPRKKNEGKRE